MNLNHQSETSSPLRVVHRPLTKGRILMVVSRVYAISPALIHSISSLDQVVEPRQVCHLFMMTIPGANPRIVGESLGGKSRSTVIEGLQSLVQRYDVDRVFRARIDFIRTELPVPVEQFDVQLIRWRR